MQSGPAETIERHWAPVAGSLVAAAVFTAAVSQSVALPSLLAAASLAIVVFRHRVTLRSLDRAAVREWARTTVAGLTIRDWLSPYDAAALYCNPNAVRARDEAQAEMNAAMMSIVRAPAPGEIGAASGYLAHAAHQRAYETAQVRYARVNLALGLELGGLLACGELLAKGAAVRAGDEGRARFIPVSRWKRLEIDIAKAKAAGADIGYVGVLIGKPGDKAAAFLTS
jgi:hypothetical protein